MARVALEDEADMLGFVTQDSSRIGEGLRRHVRVHTAIGTLEAYPILKLAFNPLIFV